MVHLGTYPTNKQLSEDSGVPENQEKEARKIKCKRMRRF